MSEEKKKTALSSKIIELINDDNGASDVANELVDVIREFMTRTEIERLFNRLDHLGIVRLPRRRIS